MKSFRQVIVLLIAIVVVAVLLFYRFEIFAFFRRANSGRRTGEAETLRLENESLKSELERLRNRSAGPAAEEYLPADVYSSYPFNDQARLIINKGSADGLREGLPVLARPGILLGRIAGVKKSQAEIQTIFDPAWRSSVGIGPTRIKALLAGAGQPALDLIAKDEIPAAGDLVVNLSADYPFGLVVGRVLAVRNDETEPWAAATLEISYNPSDLEQVLVVINFP